MRSKNLIPILTILWRMFILIASFISILFLILTAIEIGDMERSWFADISSKRVATNLIIVTFIFVTVFSGYYPIGEQIVLKSIYRRKFFPKIKQKYCKKCGNKIERGILYPNEVYSKKSGKLIEYTLHYFEKCSDFICGAKNGYYYKKTLKAKNRLARRLADMVVRDAWPEQGFFKYGIAG